MVDEAFGEFINDLEVVISSKSWFVEAVWRETGDCSPTTEAFKLVVLASIVLLLDSKCIKSSGSFLVEMFGWRGKSGSNIGEPIGRGGTSEWEVRDEGEEDEAAEA